MHSAFRRKEEKDLRSEKYYPNKSETAQQPKSGQMRVCPDFFLQKIGRVERHLFLQKQFLVFVNILPFVRRMVVNDSLSEVLNIKMGVYLRSGKVFVSEQLLDDT